MSIKIGDQEVTTVGDAATLLIATPLGYLAWATWGDPNLASPQVAAPFIGALTLGAKKAIELGWVGQWVTRKALKRRILRAARTLDSLQELSYSTGDTSQQDRCAALAREQ